MNSQQMMEEINRLARLCEAKDAEINQANSSMLETWNCARLAEEKLSEAQSQIAMQDEALNCAEYALANPSSDQNFALNVVQQTLSATSETVAAWRAKEIEPYKREVAMLVNEFSALSRGMRSSGDFVNTANAIDDLLRNTRATALAYEREVKNRGAVKALERAMEKFTGTAMLSEARVQIILQEMAAELRANKGESDIDQARKRLDTIETSRKIKLDEL